MKRKTRCYALTLFWGIFALSLLFAMFVEPTIAELQTQENNTPQFKLDHTIVSSPIIDSDGIVQFRLAVTNRSTITATNLQLRHDLYGDVQFPPFKDIKDITSTNNMPYRYDNNDNYVIWEIDELGASETVELTYDAVINSYFKTGNETIFSKFSLYFNGTFQIETKEDVLQPAMPTLELTRDRPRRLGTLGNEIEGEPRPGDIIQFTINYKNTGNHSVEEVILVDAFNEVIFQEVENINITKQGKLDGSRIRWDIGSIGAGETGSVSYSLKIKDDLSQLGKVSEGRIIAKNTAELLIAGESVVSKSDSFTLRSPILAVSISSNDLRVKTGESFRLTVSIENTGPTKAENVRLVANYDPTIGNVSVGKGQLNKDEGIVVWDNLVVPANDSATFEYTFSVNKGADVDNILHEVKMFVGEDESFKAEDSTHVTIFPDTNGIDSEKIFGFLISLLIVGTLAVIGFQLHKLTKVDELGAQQYQFYRDIIEILSVIVIVTAVLLLGFTGDLGDSQALTVLSGIAGYVLGRRVATQS